MVAFQPSPFLAIRVFAWPNFHNCYYRNSTAINKRLVTCLMTWSAAAASGQNFYSRLAWLDKQANVLITAPNFQPLTPTLLPTLFEKPRTHNQLPFNAKIIAVRRKFATFQLFVKPWLADSVSLYPSIIAFDYVYCLLSPAFCRLSLPSCLQPPVSSTNYNALALIFMCAKIELAVHGNILNAFKDAFKTRPQQNIFYERTMGDFAIWAVEIGYVCRLD